MRSKLERLAIWLVLVAYWLNIRLPLGLLYLVMGWVRTTTLWARSTWRDLVEDFRTTQQVGDL